MAANLENIRKELPGIKQELLKKANVVGLGIGYKIVEGKITGDLCFIINVEAKVAKAKLSAGDLVSETLRGIPTDVFRSGKIIAQQDTKKKWRPAPGGVSCGHFAITAGTLGCWVRKNGEFHILSNNHVLANTNQGSTGDAILQPGSHDSGVNPRDKIAELAKFIPIDFDNDNLVDGAIARAVEAEDGGSGCLLANLVAKVLNKGAAGMGRKTRLKPVKVASIDDIVRNEVLNIGVVNQLAEGELDMEVKKMGRTTSLTRNKITQIDATVNVGYHNGRTAFFVDQLITGDMSQGGDSGSIVVNNENKMVGLLFAGSGVLTVMNRSQNVFSALNITF